MTLPPNTPASSDSDPTTPVTLPAPPSTYTVLRHPTSSFCPVRHHSYHVLNWGAEAETAGAAPLVLVHGWMDVAASYQFMVDALPPELLQNRRIIAPDWRGYGKTSGPPTDNYWFPDYLADLDALLDSLCPDQAVDLVGHSMGGNVAMFYAGVRPERVRRLVNLEGFGMPPTVPAQAPTRYARWLDELKSLRSGDLALRPYADVSGVARRLMKTNPRLREDRANWLAGHWAAPNADGQWAILGDAAHKVVNANLYQVPETLACYARISAPTLAVIASHTSLKMWFEGRYTLEEYRERLKSVQNVTVADLPDAGHMLHHDQPEALAALIGTFLST
jgi:pimeloyl-ACP methyl ester carboxylesterase